MMWTLLCFILLALSEAGNITFITYFPCFETSNLTQLQDVEKCDILAYAGAQVARDAINADLNNTNHLEFDKVRLTSTTSNEVSMYIYCSKYKISVLLLYTLGSHLQTSVPDSSA